MSYELAAAQRKRMGNTSWMHRGHRHEVARHGVSDIDLG